MRPNLNKQSGNMLILALFIIVVLGGLAMSLIGSVSSASNSSLQHIYGLRALNSADAGIERLLLSTFPLNTPPQVCNQTLNSDSQFSTVSGLQSCSYQAVCETQSIRFTGRDYLAYKFSSTGVCTVGQEVFSRLIYAESVRELSP